MKRILTVLAIALLMAAMLVVMGMPAFAKVPITTTNPQGQQTSGNCNAGPQTCTATNNGGNQPPGQQPPVQ
jgi:hypothetical protein